jgi:hypothetical protein
MRRRNGDGGELFYRPAQRRFKFNRIFMGVKCGCNGQSALLSAAKQESP